MRRTSAAGGVAAGTAAGTPPADNVAVRLAPALGADDLAGTSALLQSAQVADGHAAIGEHAFLRLSAGGGGGVKAVLATAQRQLIGYGNVEPFPLVSGPGRLAAELVVHPDWRRQGVASRMLTAIIAEGRAQALKRVDIWAHHQMPGSSELAAKFGFEPTRTLYEIRLQLPEPLPAATLPEGIGLRPFAPTRDGPEWLVLNNVIFRSHPEQGNWDALDLDARMRQPWFDPADFLIAERHGRMVGYHWLKLDEASRNGEIYVIGIDPNERQKHFGSALTVLGLQRMKDRGMVTASAYVDATNSTALGMYTRIGFREDHADISYSKTLTEAQR